AADRRPLRRHDVVAPHAPHPPPAALLGAPPGRPSLPAVGPAVNAWASAALDLLYPAVCPVCDAGLGPGRRDPLCRTCGASCDRVPPPLCARCGLPLPSFDRIPQARGPWCPACVAARPPFDYARAAGVYAGVLRDALHALKFGGKRALAR